MKSQLDNHIKDSIRFQESIDDKLDNHIKESIRYKESVDKILHRYGNKLDIHEKQIYLGEKSVDLLKEARERHEVEIITIKGQQDHAANAMDKLSISLDNLTKQIGELFTIKNMAMGGFVVFSTMSVAAYYLLKAFLEYKGM